MKLISYLEKTAQNIASADIQSDVNFIVKIKYYDYDKKENKNIIIKTPKTYTVPQLSQLINKETDYKMTISSNEKHYKGQTKLYDIFKEKYIEFDVNYNADANIPYTLSFKENPENPENLSDDYK